MQYHMYSTHQQAVWEIAAQVRAFYKKGVPFRIYHGSTNSTRVTTFEKSKMIDVSDLHHILSIDKKKKTIRVEPNVPMDMLVAATLPYGFVPPVVMEFPGITVGGGIQGGAGESSSYKWGTFNRIVTQYEMILGNGEIINVSPKSHADLYWGTCGSYGSLGIITAAEIQLVQAKPYVSLTYLPVDSFDEAIQTVKKEIKKSPEYIDGVMFSATSGVIMVGSMSNVNEYPEQKFSRAHDEWFYLHTQRIADSHTKTTERIPINDYLFRYDRGAFWMGKHAFERLKTPYNRFTRWLLNPLLTTRKLYTALQLSGASQEYIIQDLALPEETVVEFMNYVNKTFAIYPIWICPLLVEDKSPLLSSYIKTKLVVNIGVWGKFSGTYEEFVNANRELEVTLKKLRGKKWLYAHTYYDEDTFWQIYDGKKKYDALRKKYHADKLPSIYEKVRVSKKHDISTKKALFFTLLGMNGIRIT